MPKPGKSYAKNVQASFKGWKRQHWQSILDQSTYQIFLLQCSCSCTEMKTRS